MSQACQTDIHSTKLMCMLLQRQQANSSSDVPYSFTFIKGTSCNSLSHIREQHYGMNRALGYGRFSTTISRQKKQRTHPVA